MTDDKTRTSQQQSVLMPFLEVFLGVSLFHLIKALGPPMGHVTILGDSALLFNYQGHCFACEFSGGLCISVYDTTSECCTRRIKPARPTRVFIRRDPGRRGGQLVGLMKDVSAHDMRINLVGHDQEFIEDEKIYCCTNIRTQRLVRAHIGFYATVKSWSPQSNELEVLFDIPFQTQSYQTLTNYINTKLAQSLFPDDDQEQGAEDWFNLDEGEAPEPVSLVKSDLCLTCPAGLCGYSYNILPDQDGTTEAGQ